MAAEWNVTEAGAEGKRLAEELAELMAQLAAELLGPGPLRALADARLRSMALEAARRALEEALRADRSDCGAANAPECAECGERMRHVSREESPAESALGRIAVPAGRHACDGCGAPSVRPRLRELDVEGSMTPAARRMASLAGASCAHEEADGLLRELAGVNFGAKRIERTTRAVGADLEARREASLSGATTVLGGGEYGAARVPERRTLAEGEVLCVALDGTGVPARPSETAGRAGRNGGAAGTREAKVGTLWIECPDGAGGRAPAPGSARFFGAVESAADDAAGDSPAARRLLRELAAEGFAPEDVGVCIGDGAEWLRRLHDEWFPQAERVVDCFHAAEYLWEAARSRYGPDSALARKWAGRLCGDLKAGRVDAVLAAPRRADGDPECRRAARHVGERRDRMRYGELAARGLPIGSGRAEAACKTVVGARLKRAGMRWTVAGANAVLSVRCARLGGRLGDYWDERLGIAA